MKRVLYQCLVCCSPHGLTSHPHAFATKRQVQQSLRHLVTHLLAAKRGDQLQGKVDRRAGSLGSDCFSHPTITPTAVVAHDHLVVLPLFDLLSERLRVTAAACTNGIARGGNPINQMVVLRITALPMAYRKDHGGRRADRSVNLPAFLLSLQQVNQSRAVAEMLLHSHHHHLNTHSTGHTAGENDRIVLLHRNVLHQSIGSLHGEEKANPVQEPILWHTSPSSSYPRTQP